MLRNVFTKSLRDQRRGIAAWSSGIGLIGLLYAVFWPMMDNPDMARAIESFPREFLEAMGWTDFLSPAGYLGSTTYGLLGPVLMILFATVLGARAVAGDEEDGRLDVLLAHPVERWELVVQRAAAMVVALAIAGITVFLLIAAAAIPVGYEEIGFGNLAAASVHLVLLGLFFGSLALSVGALTGRRGIAAGVVAIVGVSTYFANTIGPSLDVIAWTQNISPFLYYAGGRPLVNGFQAADAMVLVAASLALVGIGVLGLRRRDIAV